MLESLVAPFLVPTEGYWWIFPVLSIPHIWYCWLWYFPDAWINMCKGFMGSPKMTRQELGNAASGYMAAFAHCIKFTQFSATYYWLTLYAPSAISLETITSQSPLQLAIGVACLIIGQTFNAGIYSAIGRNGVYYGNRFGAKLGPWCDSFPFNVPGPAGRNPQYFGVVMTIIGLTTIIWTDETCKNGLPMASLVWSGYYFVSGYIESTEDKSKRTKAKKKNP
jgi:hypothetical protein